MHAPLPITVSAQKRLAGIEKLFLDEDTVERDLQDRYETLSEAVQTVMRRYGIPEPYEKLKEMTRGKAIEKSDMQKFVQNLNIPQDAKVAAVHSRKKCLYDLCHLGHAVGTHPTEVHRQCGKTSKRHQELSSGR